MCATCLTDCAASRGRRATNRTLARIDAHPRTLKEVTLPSAQHFSGEDKDDSAILLVIDVLHRGRDGPLKFLTSARNFFDSSRSKHRPKLREVLEQNGWL